MGKRAGFTLYQNGSEQSCDGEIGVEYKKLTRVTVLCSESNFQCGERLIKYSAYN